MMKKVKTLPEDALIIINPVSGKGEAKERIATITNLAKKLGWHGRYITTTLKRSAAQIAKESVEQGITHIIVCGGDGTIMEVVGEAFHKAVIIGVVPLGTGNLFAQNLGIPLTIEESLHIAIFGKSWKIDVGCANGTYFTILAGIGFDADMMRGADRKLKNKIGIFAYLYSAIINLVRSSGTYDLQIDTRKPKQVRAKSILVANMGKIQGGIRVVPQTSAESGSLCIGIVQAKNWYFWISLLYHAIQGNINKSAYYTLAKGKHVEISVLGKAKAYECDGNHFPSTNRLIIDIFPLAVTVLVPRRESVK